MKRSTSVTALIVQLLITLESAAVAAERPNILFMFTDDNALNAISAYGGPLAKIAPTPHPGRIARISCSGEIDRTLVFENLALLPRS